MRVLGVVVLFYPKEEKLVKNILSYLDQVEKLIIWNNTPLKDDCITLELLPSDKILRMGEGVNVGLGNAYNAAAAYALVNGFTHLLTMDQDSYFKKDDCRKYFKIIDEVNLKSIFSPNYLVHGREWYTTDEAFVELETTMTSGSVYLVDLFSEIGLFREDFFIDAIDTEYSLRAKKNGIPTNGIPSVYLIHGAGYQKTKHKFLWKTFFPNEYSPVRSYYIVRNGIITKHLYPWANWKGFMYYWFYKRLFFVICYENAKFAKIKGLLYGFYHGMVGKTGEQTIFK